MTDPKTNKNVIICGCGAVGLESARLLAQIGETNVEMVTSVKNIKDCGVTTSIIDIFIECVLLFI